MNSSVFPTDHTGLCHVGVGGGGLVTKSCPVLAPVWTVACQATVSMEFSRQEYRNGLTVPSSTTLV